MFKALIACHCTDLRYEDSNECAHASAKFAVLCSCGDEIHLWLISVQQQEDRRKTGSV